MKKIKNHRFLIIILVIGTISFASFLCAFKKDEGTLGSNVIVNFLADSIGVFKFPADIFITDNTKDNFLIAELVVNILFYAILVNLLIKSFFTGNKKGVVKTTPR